ncbi:MAG: serine/threonine-protein kinase [Kofleriaceae bacterium]
MRPDPCLGEDELLALGRGALADAPDAEAHLASCATCSALVAGIARDAPPPWDLLAGAMLGPYRIDAQIGAGGMGAVYRAWDPRLDRAIAIKVLHSEGNATRLAAEARAAAAIDHRAIVSIHDVGTAAGVTYVAMELVDGESVRSVIERGPLGIARARELLLELVDGLAAAHARGVIHRDLKPENLVLARGGLRVLDFGLAKLLDGGALDETEPGTVQGTAGYMAPEQARGEPADARVDLFAAGAIAYELVTGTRAFPGATHADRLSATLRDMPPLEQCGPLGPVIERCLAKDRSDRFQSAADLAWALRAVPADAVPRTWSRRAWLVAGAGALVTGALGFVLGRRGSHAPAIAEPRPLTYRNGRVFTARFTRDGSRIVYGAAWDGEPLAIFVADATSGVTHALELAGADVLAVSTRGELAASLDHRFVDHQSARGRLVALPIAGGEPRPLADDVQDADFAADGTLAITRATPAGFRIELPIGTPLVDERGWITHVRISPDGARVAYLAHPHTNDDAGAVIVVEVATKTRQVLAPDWASIAGLVWDPGGDALWFTASREDLTTSLRRVTLAGELTSHPRSGGRQRIHDIAADRMLVTADTWRLRALAGDRDLSRSDISYVTDLAADGSRVVIAELGGVEEGNGAYIVPYAGGRALRLGAGFPFAISPSGDRIAAAVGAKVVVYSTASGDAPVIAAPPATYAGRWLDEHSLIGVSNHQLWRLAAGAEPIAIAVPSPLVGMFALDPARRRLAFVAADSALRILDVATGTLRALPGTFAHTEVCGWLADPDAIAVRSTTTPILIDRIDPSTGTRTRHAEIRPPAIGMKAVDAFVLHADGVRHAYSYGQELSQLFVTDMPPTDMPPTDMPPTDMPR